MKLLWHRIGLILATKPIRIWICCTGIILEFVLQCNRPATLFAQSNSFVPQRLQTTEIKLDGRLNEEIWKQIQPLDSWYRLTPDEGSPPSQKTAMWLAYDNEAIYLAADLKESNLSAIMTRTLERDSFNPDQDAICILLDTYNDNRTAFGFIITAAGVKTDMAVFNDGEAHFRSWNTDWNTFWDAAVNRNETGWSAEVRIPFSSLRFESSGGKVEMGLILWRYLARNAEYNIFPAIPNKWQQSAFKPSQALDIHFTRISNRNPLYLKPYSLGGVYQNNLLLSDSTHYQFHNNWKRDVGLDLKYNLTSNLILDLTANTDFAQVEVDDQRINTTRFSLFFPEKRDFFQERADLFRFRFPGGTQRLFQSRRIGIVSGQTVPILGGVRMTGRLGAWELGFIEMQTDKVVVDDEEIASENFGVIRVQREAFERGSFIGGMVTSRTDFKGTYNVVVGADCDIRMLGPQYLKIQAGQSMEPGSSASQSRFASVTVQRRIRRGFSFGTSIGHYGSEFNPAVGFINRLGINRFGARTQYTWFPASKHILQNHTLTNRFSFIWGANSPYELETFDTRFSWDGLFKSGARANASLRFRQESIVDTFSVGEVDIIPSKYDFLFGEIRFGTPSGDALRFDIEGGAGGYFGGKQFRMQLSPSWSVDKHLAFKLEYEYNRIKVGRQLFNAHLTRLRVRSAFNHALSINAFVQYNSESAELAMNIRLRYNPVEGSDFYLVFNENVNTLLDPEIDRLPQLPRTQSRAILLKYNYTFIK